MKSSWIIAGIVVLAGLNGPWLIEGASNNCAAVERLAVRSAAAKQEDKNPDPFVIGFMAVSDGRIAVAAAQEKLPDVPTPLACAIAYYTGLNGKP